jgi:serine protease inhibitor
MKWIAVLLSIFVVLLISSCAETPDGSNQKIPLVAVTYPEAVDFEDFNTRREVLEQNPVDSDFLAALNSFSYATASSVLSGAASNANYSPLSLYFALALAGTGANGETQSQIFDLLGVSSGNEVSAQCGNLYRLFYTDHEISKLKIANSLWLDNHTVFHESFVQNAAGNFYAGAYEVDFADETTGKIMGRWISDNTNGTLSPDFQTDAEQILSIINTVYFYDEWINSFSEARTAEAVFHAPKGDVKVDFMNQTMSSSSFAKGDGFIRSSLGLKGSGQMVFILPDEGMSVSELLSSAEGVRMLFEGGESGFGEVIWQIPKFSFDSEYELVDILKTLGMTDAFEQNADFSGMTDGTAFITGITQQTHIAINENGVEASAFTNITYVGSAMSIGRAEIFLDRPFIYGITAADGTLLFVGVCSNPETKPTAE